MSCCTGILLWILTLGIARCATEQTHFTSGHVQVASHSATREDLHRDREMSEPDRRQKRRRPMPVGGSMRIQIGELVIATSIVQLANGFFGTFISLRVAIEDFDAAGLVLSAYFAGFTVGALRSGKLIERIGHIRAFAAFDGLVVAATCVMPLLVGSLAWVVLRAIVGFGCAGIFVTTESWLNAKATPSGRGRVFSIYMVGTFLALALGQLLIAKADIESTAPFNKIAALFTVALIMVTAARAEPPRISATAALPPGVLVRAAPIAVVGAAV